MIVDVSQELRDLINNAQAVKVLVVLSETGIPLAELKESVFFNEDANIEYLELLEGSQSYKNFTRSLWYDKKVSFLISGENGLSFQIIGKPIKILVSGPLYEKKYIGLREELGDVDLAAVCITEIEEIIDNSFNKKFEEQEKLKPIFKHLDRLAK